ncbi:hypothetical protein R1flu_022178 [Riccia fluitans]|uniref:Fe2OG dioxygenase domain-containing protein n=1 Tax=Riccia fluitans TaxID=41844 RepID=A0ABD1ZSM5_9MARC
MASFLQKTGGGARSCGLRRLIFPPATLRRSSIASGIQSQKANDVQKLRPVSEISPSVRNFSFNKSLINQHGGFWCSGLRRDRLYYATSSTDSSATDGEAIASQMIDYAASCRKDESAQLEAVRVLEQGLQFLQSRGSAATHAAGKVMLTLATVLWDSGNLADALDVLQDAANLDGASPEIRVPAMEALIAVLLRKHRDSDALAEAHKCLKLVKEADGLPKAVGQELDFRANATMQFVQHVSKFKYTGDILDMSGLSSWLTDKDAQVDGVAAALLGLGECAHSRADLSHAKDLYEKALALSDSSVSKGTPGMSAAAMNSREVRMGALAGLGQVALHLGNVDEAEVQLTKSLNYAEQISGDKHRRVGAVLACLADVYAKRGKARGTGDLTLTEGLYRKATELLHAPLPDDPESGKDSDLGDVAAIARARYGAFLSHMKQRESEASKLQAWAAATWKGPRSLSDVLEIEASSKTRDSTHTKNEKDTEIGKCVVVDKTCGQIVAAWSGLGSSRVAEAHPASATIGKSKCVWLGMEKRSGEFSPRIRICSAPGAVIDSSLVGVMRESGGPVERESVKILDMESYLSGDGDRVTDFCEQLRRQCHGVGFFYVRNHGVPEELCDRMLEMGRGFFDLPTEVKMQMDYTSSPQFRGYMRIGVENTAGITDFREQIELGPEESLDIDVVDGKESGKVYPLYRRLRGPNQWPPEVLLPSFKRETELFMGKMNDLSMHIMQALALSLGLQKHYFDATFQRMPHYQMKVVRYPPQPESDGLEGVGMFGVGAHSDSGFLSLLLQDDVGGLQAQTIDGGWIDVPPEKGTLVVNLGEMLQLATGGYYLATVHRVVSQNLRYLHSDSADAVGYGCSVDEDFEQRRSSRKAATLFPGSWLRFMRIQHS